MRGMGPDPETRAARVTPRAALCRAAGRRCARRFPESAFFLVRAEQLRAAELTSEISAHVRVEHASRRQSSRRTERDSAVKSEHSYPHLTGGPHRPRRTRADEMRGTRQPRFCPPFLVGISGFTPPYAESRLPDHRTLLLRARVLGGYDVQHLGTARGDDPDPITTRPSVSAPMG